MSSTKLEKTRGYKLYELLHLSKDASGEDIKKAYKKAALRHHPDKGGDPKKFKEIVSAFNILSDPEQRRLYDESEERACKAHIREEAVIRKNTREGGPLGKPNLRKEAVIKKTTRERGPLDKPNVRKEAVIKKTTRERGPLDEGLFGIFDNHFGERPHRKDVYNWRRTTEDKDFTKRIHEYIFPALS